MWLPSTIARTVHCYRSASQPASLKNQYHIKLTLFERFASCASWGNQVNSKGLESGKIEKLYLINVKKYATENIFHYL